MGTAVRVVLIIFFWYRWMEFLTEKCGPLNKLPNRVTLFYIMGISIIRMGYTHDR